MMEDYIYLCCMVHVLGWGTISMASLPYVRIINTLILLNRGVSVTGGGLGVFLAVAPLCNVVDSD